MQIIQKKERVIIYIDGFNLYFGIVEAGLNHCKWLNLRTLMDSLLKPNQELTEIKYFISRVSNNPEKQKRQSLYIEALESVGINIYYGHFQSNTVKCDRCGNTWHSYNEKMTDVNIATQMIIDVYKDRYDMAMLVSGDSDLVPPIREIHENFKQKRIFVAFPPRRHNNSVALVAKGSITIGRKKLVDSQFPLKVQKQDGYILRKPIEWM